MSNPKTSNFFLKALTSGKPTYPKPIIAIFFSFYALYEDNLKILIGKCIIKFKTNSIKFDF